MFDPTMMSHIGVTIHEDRLRTAGTTRPEAVTQRDFPRQMSRVQPSLIPARPRTVHRPHTRTGRARDVFTAEELARLRFQRWLLQTRRLKT